MPPIYTYACSNCGKQIEKIESFSAEPVQDCQECFGQKTLNRTLSNSSFVLNGNGWAKHGYQG